MPTADKGKDEFWRNIINNKIEGELSEGATAPTIESTHKPRRSRSITEGNRKVMVQKIATVIYVFTDTEGKVYTSNTSQHLYILGQMTLEEGLKLSHEDTA